MNGLTRRAALSGAASAGAAGLMGVLAACGTGPAAPAQTVPPARIRFTTQNTSPPHSDNETEVVNLFRERNKNVQVEMELYKGEDVREKLIVLSAGGTAPDVADIETKWMPGLYVKNLLVDLTPHAKRMGIKADDYYPQEWQKAQIGGKLLCFPLDLQIVVLFFNKDLFQAKGVKPPPAKWDDPSWTWDEALLRARQLTGGEGAQRTFGVDFSRGWVYSYPLIWSAGGSVLNKDHTKATLTDAATVDAIQFRADLILKHKVHPDPDELKAGTDAMTMFINKRLAMEAIWSPWAFRIAAKDTNVNYDLAPMPRGKSGSFTRAPSDALIVLSGTKAPEAAAALAAFVGGEEGQRRLVAGAGLGIPPLKKIARSDDFLKPNVKGAEGRNYQVVLDALEQRHYKFQDVTTAWDDMSKLLTDGHNKVLLGQITAAEMARTLAPQIDQLLAGVTPEGRAFVGD
jgi:multiple sugar transport system substrate-binding protein